MLPTARAHLHGARRLVLGASLDRASEGECLDKVFHCCLEFVMEHFKKNTTNIRIFEVLRLFQYKLSYCWSKLGIHVATSCDFNGVLQLISITQLVD